MSTPISVYSRTFLQELRRLTAYRTEFWLETLLGPSIRVTAAYFVWLGVYEARGMQPIGTLDFTSMVLYVCVALFIAEITAAHWEPIIAYEIRDGAMTRYLVYPLSVIGYKLSARAARMCLRLAQLSICALLAFWALDIPFPKDLSAARLCAGGISIVLATGLAFFLYLCVEFSAFWAGETYGLAVLMQFILYISGGALIPIELFPKAIALALGWTPFPFILSEPTRMLLGQMSYQEWASGLSVAIVWLLILILLAHLIFERGRRIYTGVGI